MDYFEIIKRAWQITAKYKFLWVFGLFLGISGGGGFNGVNFNQISYTTGDIDMDKFTSQAHDFFFGNLILVIAITLFFLLILLFFIFAKIASQGALIGGVESIEENKEINFSKALKAGTKNFWKIFGLNVLLGIITVTCLLLLATPTIALFIHKMPGRGLLMLLLSLAIFIPMAVLISFTSTYALRHIVIKKEGIISSARSGFDLFKNHIGQTFLIWLILFGINIVISLISAIIILILFLIIGIPLIILGIVLYPLAGMASTTILIIAGIIILLFMALLISSVVNTYNSAVWTLTFRKLTVK